VHDNGGCQCPYVELSFPRVAPETTTNSRIRGVIALSGCSGRSLSQLCSVAIVQSVHICAIPMKVKAVHMAVNPNKHWLNQS